MYCGVVSCDLLLAKAVYCRGRGIGKRDSARRFFRTTIFAVARISFLLVCAAVRLLLHVFIMRYVASSDNWRQHPDGMGWCWRRSIARPLSRWAPIVARAWSTVLTGTHAYQYTSDATTYVHVMLSSHGVGTTQPIKLRTRAGVVAQCVLRNSMILCLPKLGALQIPFIASRFQRAFASERARVGWVGLGAQLQAYGLLFAATCSGGCGGVPYCCAAFLVYRGFSYLSGRRGVVSLDTGSGAWMQCPVWRVRDGGCHDCERPGGWRMGIETAVGMLGAKGTGTCGGLKYRMTRMGSLPATGGRAACCCHAALCTETVHSALLGLTCCSGLVAQLNEWVTCLKAL